MRIVVYNLGCKVNQYESDGIIHELSERGYDVSPELGWADAYILNTCAVTNEAERKSRQAVARCAKYNPNATIIVCGCASQNNSEQFYDKDGVTFVGGVAGKAHIPDILQSKGIFVQELPLKYEDDLQAKTLRTRAYVKVQDGCNNFCSYCLIPYLRGRSRSRAIDSIVEECIHLEREGVKEIVLTGINLSAYGQDIDTSLKKLVSKLNNINVRLRLGSLEVGVIDEAFLIELSHLKVFCPQFHLSLQSGNDSTLRHMNRHYTTQEYNDKVSQIRTIFPHAAITTDLICGYPSETEEEFCQTLEFIDKVKFSDMHIFAYSRREGTAAAKLPLLDNAIVKERCLRAEKVASKNKIAYLNDAFDRELEVLVEDDNNGYSREYIRVYFDNVKSNTIKKVIPTELYKDGVRCKE